MTKIGPIFYTIEITVEDIAKSVFSELSYTDREYISHLLKDELINYHHTWGRDIRNKYQLWHPDHPITQTGVNVIDGIDYSDNHPDYYSMKVIERIWELCND